MRGAGGDGARARAGERVEGQRLGGERVAVVVNVERPVPEAEAAVAREAPAEGGPSWSSESSAWSSGTFADTDGGHRSTC